MPDGLVAGVAGQAGRAGPLRYDLPPLGFAEWELAVRGVPGAAPGHYFLAARIHDQLGQVIEDAAAVYLGLPPRRPSPCRWMSWCPRSGPISRPSRRNST